MAEIIRVEHQTVRFFDGLEVDGAPFAQRGISRGTDESQPAVGLGVRIGCAAFGRRGGTALNALRGLGFTEQIEEVVRETSRGDRPVRTIGLLRFQPADCLRGCRR